MFTEHAKLSQITVEYAFTFLTRAFTLPQKVVLHVISESQFNTTIAIFFCAAKSRG